MAIHRAGSRNTSSSKSNSTSKCGRVAARQQRPLLHSVRLRCAVLVRRHAVRDHSLRRLQRRAARRAAHVVAIAVLRHWWHLGGGTWAVALGRWHLGGAIRAPCSAIFLKI
eukprot:3454793-Prymnesium_polylepis.2